MGKSKAHEYVERFSQQMVQFNPYTIRKTGLIQNQTLLKVEDYLLICAPYQLSMLRAILLVILSPQEAVFFKRFQTQLGSINFAFQQPDRQPMSFFVRASLDRIGPVKGRSNVCLFDLTYKSQPNLLIEILGNYLNDYTELKTQFETFKNRLIPINRETTEVLRFNRVVELFVAGTKVKPELFSMAANRLVVNVSEPIEGLKRGLKVAAKLYFQAHQFVAHGSITNVTDTVAGKYQVQVELDFSPELVEVLDDYFTA